MEKLKFNWFEVLEGVKYHRFIDWACDRSDVVMLVYRYMGSQEGEDHEAYEYDRKLDIVRESLKPYLIKDVNSDGDYPDAYELDENRAVKRETCPESFINLDIDRCVPLVKTYRWPWSGSVYCVYREFGEGKPPDIYIQYYRLTPEVRAVLHSVDSFAMWHYPNKPEDPCFFRDGVCWFVSVIHEQMYGILGGNKEVGDAINEMDIDFGYEEDTGNEVWTIPT